MFTAKQQQGNNIAILVFTFIIFICLFKPRFAFNEFDVLPYAYAVYNGDWLPNDWYLNLKIEYRYFFSYLTGFFVEHLGFVNVVIFGRLLTYLLFSMAFNQLRRLFKLNLLYSMLALTFFTLVLFQTLFVGEWMVGGFETKAFAYPFVLMALYRALKKEYFLMFLFSGLAVSFHLLVGLYAFFCLMVLLVYQLLSERQELKTELTRLLKSVWILPLTGAMGAYSVLIYLKNFLDPQLSGNGWEIYVNYRVPHHAYPNLSLKFWILLPLMVGFNAAIFYYTRKCGQQNNEITERVEPQAFLRLNYFIVLSDLITRPIKKRKDLRALAVYNFAALFITFIGFVVYWTGQTDLLRFYFFRFADTVLPFSCSLYLFILLQEYFQGNYTNVLSRGRQVGLGAFIMFILLVSQYKKIPKFINPDTYSESRFMDYFDEETANWIQENTEKETIFIIPVSKRDFYLAAQRSSFVSFKHSPQKGADIEEWFKRMMLLNRGETVNETPIFMKQVDQNYQELTKAEVLKIKEEYQVDYMLFECCKELDLPVVFRNEQYVLYKIR